MAVNHPPLDPAQMARNLRIVTGMAPAEAAFPKQETVIATLLTGEMELQGLMPWSSNYTFLTRLVGANEVELLGIYKPGQGERPLWDFPDFTLSHREFASYVISQVLGWPAVPPTVLRDGPHGAGSVQLFIEAEYEAHYFNMRDIPAFTETFRKMALFDFVVNNADRKGGHCLKGKDGQIWAIDHGLTFHTDPKLRTVIWEFSEEAIPAEPLADLTRLQDLLENSELCQIMADLISPREIEALKRRIHRLVKLGRFPTLQSGRNVPYPPI
jgi:uncharacterized repeat protein (TIGR03843 family)